MKKQIGFKLELLQWRFQTGGFTYEGLAETSGLSANAIWKINNGLSDPTSSTLKALFPAMGLDLAHAFNDKLKKSQFRRAVVATAR